MTNAQQIAEALGAAKSSGTNTWMCRCPIHEDGTASLAITDGDDGKIKVYCHAGCNEIEILQHLEQIGLKENTFKRSERKQAKKKQTKPAPPAKKNEYGPNLKRPAKPRATYFYRNRSGDVIYKKDRTPNKDFYFSKKTETGWINGLQGMKKVLYNLPALSEAVEKLQEIFIVEGEEDVNTASALGLIATCNSEGAGEGKAKWHDRYTECIAGARNVYVIPDNDDAGYAHATYICEQLTDRVGCVKLVPLPTPTNEQGFDLSDFIHDGGTREQLLELCRRAPRCEAVKQRSSETVEENKTPAKLKEYTLLTEYLRQVGEDDLRFFFGYFWHWLDGSWQRLDEEEIAQHLLNIAVSMGEPRSALIEATRRLLKKAVLVPERKLPKLGECDAVNYKNGTARFVDGQWRLGEADKNEYRLFQIPHDYNPNAACPAFEKFLKTSLGNRYEDLRRTVYQAIGVALLQDARFQVCFWLLGPGGTGKGTLLQVIERLFGDENCCTVVPQDFSREYYKAELVGKQCNIVNEVGSSTPIEDGPYKAIISGDKISARIPCGTVFRFAPTATHFFSANGMPTSTDPNQAFFRRNIPIPFDRVVSDEEKDPSLARKLSRESEGILARSMEHVAELIELGHFPLSDIAREMRDEWADDSDQARAFAVDCLDFGEQYDCTSKLIYDVYRKWVEDNHRKHPIGSAATLGRRLRSAYPEKLSSKKGTGGIRLTVGIRPKRILVGRENEVRINGSQVAAVFGDSQNENEDLLIGGYNI